MPDYDAIYRKMNPRTSPFGLRRELRDLWESDQQKFREIVDQIVEAQEREGGQNVHD